MAQTIDLSTLPLELIQELLFGSDRLRILQQQKRPIGEHLADYRAKLESKGKAKHVRDAMRRVRLMVRLCRASSWRQVDEAAVHRALVKLRSARPRRKSIGLATVNHYLHALKAFSNWMVEQTRADRSPCRAIKPFPAQTDVRHPRRAMTQEEVLKLIAAATNGKAIAGIPGSERALTYVLATTTGLRAGELQSLTRSSFHLGDGGTDAAPHLIVQAAYTKNKKPATVPLRADVARLISAYLEETARDEKLFRLPTNGTRALKADLKSAGVPYVLNGEFADFHSQRHTFVSNLFDSGASPKEAQTLARHQDARLTLGRYAHVAPAAQRAAVERLPAVSRPLISEPVAVVVKVGPAMDRQARPVAAKRAVKRA